MKGLRTFSIGLAVAFALILGAASQSWAACGNAVLDFDPIKGTNEQCDNGAMACTGGLRAGQPCARDAECPGTFDCGTCNATGGGTCDTQVDTGIEGNRDDVGDQCRSDCTLPTCGDGITDGAFGEECDDGNDSNSDGCLNTCEEADCGDGFICTENNPDSPCVSGPTGGKEQCDSGDPKGGDGCSTSCAVQVCGDGSANGGEECDSGAATCDATNPATENSICATEVACLGGNCSGGNPGDAGPGTDNRDDISNTCRTDCTFPTCGDGITDALFGEACDDGNDSNNDGCLTTCDLATCGDGFICTENNPISPCVTGPTGGKEQCDVGDVKGAEGCTGTNPEDPDAAILGDCALTSCGDGVVQDGEGCDVGQATCDATNPVTAGRDCARTSDCLGGVCSGAGNPATDNRDDLPNSCRSTCQLPTCGDGVSDNLGGEECDDGNTSDTDGCTTSCDLADCGDGFVCSENNPASSCNNVPIGGDLAAKEACDDGNNKSGDGCNALCVTELCGDGTIQDGEECDQGTAVCSAGLAVGQPCTTSDDCGGPTGQCGADDISTVDNRDDVPNACRSNCVLPTCGDGQSDTGEECDDGNASNNDSCLTNCRAAVCGDGNVCSFDDLKDPTNPSNCVPPEQCDDGNNNPDDGCDACALTSCGNNNVESGEQCDLGTAVCDADSLNADSPCTSDAGCLPTNPAANSAQDCTCAGALCVANACVGTGFTCAVDADCCGSGGNVDAPDQCRSDCQLPTCGDGVSDAGEFCDDGNQSNTDSCTTTCQLPACGDGFVQPVNGEFCDDGNTLSGDGCAGTDVSAPCTVEACGDGITNSSFDATAHEECDAGIPLQHPDQNGGPTPVQHQGSCTSVCCWFGGISPEGQPSSPTLPVETFTNVDAAFDSLTGCHTPKLLARSQCSRYVSRSALRIEKLISQGRSAYNSNNFQKAIRRMRRAKRVLERFDRGLTKSRVDAACGPLTGQLSDQAARISAINSDVQNSMPLF